MSGGGVTVRVDERSLRECVHALGQITPRVREEAVTITNEAAIIGQRVAVNRAPTDTGRLKKSIRFVLENDGEIAVLSTTVKYAPHVEYGTRHRRMPPASALNNWARRHGMGRNAGFIVARGIQRRGSIKERPFMRPGATFVGAKLKSSIPRLRAVVESEGS